ncbi:Ankyrin repeat domain-containing protein 6 [Liparis tanakae]|uniref:Ankyrin repeat domain-containing protein 6 n=1 Tax=Liparis tanakae TaxID=230148 RepID=A0A4Z2FNW5_9TELE|nr:Ankyrin repeat domain-containing protein 6 [Liparis tanakae]
MWSVCPEQDSSVEEEATPTSGQTGCRTTPQAGPGLKSAAAISSPHSRGRRRRVKEQALNEKEERKGERDFRRRRNQLWRGGGSTSRLHPEPVVRQPPANGCLCEPLLGELERQLKATQEETRLHLLQVQEQVNGRLGRMDHRTRLQMKALAVLNQEGAAADRKWMVYQMEQRAEREEAQLTQNIISISRKEKMEARVDRSLSVMSASILETDPPDGVGGTSGDRLFHPQLVPRRQQAAVNRELKSWCTSQLKRDGGGDGDGGADGGGDGDVPAKARYYKLLPSPSVEQCDPESLPLLSVVSGDSSSSLATYVNILPCTSVHGLGGRAPSDRGVDRSPDDYENTPLFPSPANHTSVLLLGSVDPLWQPAVVHDRPLGAVKARCGRGFSSSSSQCSIFAQRPRQHQEQRADEPDRKRSGEPLSTCRRVGIHTEGTRTLEFFIHRPAECSFSQERNNQHAIEVTQRFFESVSTQLERWYERKTLEVEQQTELRAQQDKKELLQQIGTLEAELQKLKTNEDAESRQ